MVAPDLVGADDPFKDQLADDVYWNPGVLLFTLIGMFWKPALNLRAYFPFHNYRQVHVGEIAFWDNWNNGAFSKLVVPNITECPLKWVDVEHYWTFCGFLGMLAYEVAAHIRVVVAISIIILGSNVGSLTPEKAWDVLAQELGFG